MLTATLRFPLGVYHALGAGTGAAAERRRPEWPPSPVRIIGALLDAAHSQPGGATSEALMVINSVADAGAPTVRAPWASYQPEADDLAVIDGPSRWAPRNPSKSELRDGLSLRDLAGPRAAVDKGGVAVGDIPVHVVWPSLELNASEVDELNRVATDVAWLGTSRSPVLMTFSTEAARPSDGSWVPVAATDPSTPDTTLRVAHGGTVAAFDAAFAQRRSPKQKVVGSGLQKPASAGTPIGYAWRDHDVDVGAVHDPEQWGQVFVLEVSSESPTLPKSTATYLVARTVRRALLDQFEAPGTAGEAPRLLRGRGSTPHVAIVPLPFVGPRHGYADGLIKGVAIFVPHPRRLAGELDEVLQVEQALAGLLSDGDTDAGVVRLTPHFTSGTTVPHMLLRETIPVTRPLQSLDLARYRGPSREWTTVTPVVHSRWQAAKSQQALVDQVAADCAHVGLPVPELIDVLPEPALRGSPPAHVDRRGLPADWRGPVDGPTQHLRLTFPVPVRGPIVLGRARHFGLGLLMPAIRRGAA